MQKTLLTILLLAPSMLVMEKRIEVYTPNPVPQPEVIIHVIQEDETILNLDRISFYNPVPRQTDGDPNVSSCGPNVENQIAVSQDLFFDDNGRKHLCGMRATIITNRGEVFNDYVIWDTMNPRYENTVDIMLPHDDEQIAMNLGVTAGVIYIYD